MSAAGRRRVRRVVELLEETYGPRTWRPRRTGLEGLIATILSQNTSDRNSSAAFRSLRQRFPSWEAVRRAPVVRIADAIRPAGLANVKARRIKSILQRIHAERGRLSLEFLGRLPAHEARAWLDRFEGVGPKTSACVLMFNFGMPVLPVDTHVHRLSQRLGLVGPRVDSGKAHQVLERLVPGELVYPFHVLLIEHGRKVCRRRRPLCEGCVLRRLCVWRRREGGTATSAGKD